MSVIVFDPLRFQRSAWEQLRRASTELSRGHLKGMLEAILFAASAPLPLRDLVRVTKTKRAFVSEILAEILADFAGRGVELNETFRGYTFLTNPAFGAVVREITGKKPVRMSRAQLETLAILAYRQPITRPEIDEVRGVDSGPVLRTLLDRELVRVLGKKEEPGRPLLYGTSDAFLELFSLKSLEELPALREFTELSDDSRSTYERRLGESAPAGAISFDDEPDEPIDPTQPLAEELMLQVQEAAQAEADGESEREGEGDAGGDRDGEGDAAGDGDGDAGRESDAQTAGANRSEVPDK